MSRAAIILILFLLSACGGEQKPQQEQYYGFYESDKGAPYKLFRHNIFGFEIDIPVEWQFGVTGTGPEAVIMIFNPEIDTNAFSAGYHTLSVGVLPVRGATLKEAFKATLRGVTQSHTGAHATAGPDEITVNGMEGLRFAYEWTSKTGLTIREDIRLVKSEDKIYSVNIRTVNPVPGSVLSAYEDAIATLKIL